MKSRYLQYDKKDAKKVLGRLAAGLKGRPAKAGNGVRGGSDLLETGPKQKNDSAGVMRESWCATRCRLGWGLGTVFG